jgi:2',3'-cyclic-nucleotide 2'-phosphodiesterase (5'-nucleotidase family)
MSFRVNPYLQQPSSDGMYFTWFTEEDTSGELNITGPGLENPLSFTTDPTFESVLSYTEAELNQEIDGLEQGSWLLGDENYKHTVDVNGLSPNSTYQYTVTVGDEVFESSFQTAPTADNWNQVRFFALSDSETEPRGRVRRRDWQEGALESESLERPALEGSLWADTLGVSGDRLNYPLTENVGYRNNLEIINSRNPDFMVMPGDLVQGGGYQPGWDEFFRHNAGEFDSGLSEYPILPALGNWENFGALNGGYGTDADGRFGPKFGHDKFHAYFDAPPNGTPEHQDNYYRIDYGPITVLTLDTSNGEPDDSRDNYGGEGQPPQISGQEFTEPGTDTQQNFTREQYEAAGGTDLADFNPGSPQWNWTIEQLEDAREDGQIIFAQFHHVPYSNGTHGLPMNHVDSSGQGGTPMRKYHPLFEEYEVAAVFSGHSEMFERSFVDEDGDGIGVNYYDVGVAGDGMRGERQTEDGELLSYNPFSQWTADQSEPELWEEVDGVLQNVAGGKHYGHLEVNLEQTGEGSAADITLTPVYSFPTLDSEYNLVDTERQVYGDEITIQTNADGTIAMNDNDNDNFILQLFHFSDGEANTDTVTVAPQASAVYNALRAQDIDGDGEAGYSETVLVNSGDAWIPGLFYDASEEVYGLPGAADVEIHNELGVQVISFGNHEFDNGNDPIARLLDGIQPEGDFEPFDGADFPYISGNLDFSENVTTFDEDGEVDEFGLADLVTDDHQPAEDIAGQIAATTVIQTDAGTRIGVVGATTPQLDEGLTSPSEGTAVAPEDPDDIEALAAVIQEDVDALLAANPDLNKVILLAHMQDISIEQELATLLTDVDIIVAGGSNTRLFDENDIGFQGEEAQGEYPFFTQDADGKNIAVVNTDANYKYIGRLVIEFDENGEIIPESYDADVSGAYATDEAGVERVGGEGLEDPEIQEIANAVNEVIVEGESEFYAVTEVFLNGERQGGGLDGVRTQETNLANLTGDANLAYARSYDPEVLVSIKNGGGIRQSIGVIETTGLGDQERLPPEGIEGVKPEGGISQNDVGNTLAFNNGLVLLSFTTAELAQAIEDTLSEYTSLEVDSGMDHYAGIQFSFDPDLPAGDRVVNAAVVDDAGEVLHPIVEDGEVVDNGDLTIRVVTLDFLANSALEGFGTDRVDLATLPESSVFNAVDTFDSGGEQDALAEYLFAEFGTDPGAPTITAADTPPELDERIQNLDFREDTVFGEAEPSLPMPVFGSLGDDTLEAGIDLEATNDLIFTGEGEDSVFASQGEGGNRAYSGSGNDELFAGTRDRLFGGSGNDSFDSSVGGGNNRLYGGEGDDDFFNGNDDRLIGGAGDDRFFLSEESGDSVITGGSGADAFWIANAGFPTEANTITDFTGGEDVLGIAGIGAADISDLEITASGDDSAIAFDGNQLAILLGIDSNSLTNNNFVFAESQVG